MIQQKTLKRLHHKKATNVAQDTILLEIEDLNKGLLKRMTGGQNVPTNTIGWDVGYAGNDLSPVLISPDNKYVQYHGKILPVTKVVNN
jgi:hypothetical protein